MASTPWPLPMSHQDVALRQRCARLLQALQRIGGEAWAVGDRQMLSDSATSFTWLFQKASKAFHYLRKTLDQSWRGR